MCMCNFVAMIVCIFRFRLLKDVHKKYFMFHCTE